MATLQVRTNEKTKKAAQLILSNLGLDLSTAINMYLVQIVVNKGIPFDILTENGITPVEEAALLRDLESAKRSKKSYSSARAAHKAILGK